MSHRFLTSVGVLAGVIAVASLLAVPVAEQATKPKAAPAKAYAVPHTPWGDPDLQGIWNDATSTPLQRPARLGEKGVLTEEEADQFAEELAENLNRDRRDGGPEVDVNRAYNEHWMDAKRLNATADRRTSLIIDPADGRLPPAVPPTPEVATRRAAQAAAGARFLAGMPAEPEETSLAFRCWSDTGARYTTHLTERFTRVAEDRINYEYTVNDPTQFTKPWTAMVPWNKADGQVYEYACHEGNYDMVHLLAGGRAREKAGEAMVVPTGLPGGALNDDR